MTNEPDEHAIAFETTMQHVVQLLVAIGEICEHYCITEDEITNLDNVWEIMQQAEAFVDPRPITTRLTIVCRNNVPIAAHRCHQSAINYCTRMSALDAEEQKPYRTTRITTRVSMGPKDTLLTAEFNAGFWYFEPHDDNRTYDTALLLVPVE